MGSMRVSGTRSCSTVVVPLNSTVETSASPASRRCFAIIELKPPMVSASRPNMEPLRSRIKTSSVNCFFI